MNPLLRCVLVLLLLAGCCYTSVAQVTKTYSGVFNRKPFREVVKWVEGQNPAARIYYPTEELGELIISFTAEQRPLLEFIREALLQTNWKPVQDYDGAIYITRDQPIETNIGVKQASQLSPKTTGTSSVEIPIENRMFVIGDQEKKARTNAVVSGYIRNVYSGEALIGINVSVDGGKQLISTNTYGYYSVVLPEGRHELLVTGAGMKSTRRQIQLYSSGQLDIELEDAVANLTAVVVTADKNSTTRGLQVGTNRLSIRAIKQVPVVFGETDLLKVVLSLPGVTSVGEASNGFNVRGGSADQNLILMSDATIYNPSHLFGFFSGFNAELVKQVELYKASIPEKFGGRLSSVLDIQLQDGNAKRWSGTAGVGPLTSKAAVSGPIIKDKLTLSAGARTTYSNWIMRQLPEKEFRNSRGSFYDANVRLSFTASKKTSIYLTAYTSDDAFRFNADTSYQYGNKNINLKWKQQFNPKLTGVFTIGTDHYNYRILSRENDESAFRLKFSINQYFTRNDFTYTLSNKHTLSAGITSTYYTIHPGAYSPEGEGSLVNPVNIEAERGLESAVYLGDQFAITSRFSISAGIRFSLFQNFGPRTVYNYSPGMPKDSTTVVGVDQIAKGQLVQKWSGPEYRFSARYMLNENSSVKLSLTTTQQFIQMLSNTVTVAPLDIWKLSDRYMKPQKAIQLAAGYYYTLPSSKWELSVEAYIKRMQHVPDFKSGARLLLNDQLETQLINTRGKAYGAELLLRRAEGRLNGWFAYTYSRAFLQQDDQLAGETINNGQYYPANYDRPHNVNMVGNYRFSHRLSLSVNMVYTTGRPITLPIAIFTQGGVNGLLYSDRNKYRIPDYFRTDISFTIEGNHKLNQRFHNSWSFGAYNVLARENPFSVYYVQQQGRINGYQLSIFGTIIPFVSYNIRF